MTFIISGLMMLSQVAMANVYEDCWTFPTVGELPSTDVVYHVERQDEEFFKVRVYMDGKFFATSRNKLEITPSASLGEPGYTCSLYGYNPQGTAHADYSVTTTLYFQAATKEQCKKGNFRVVTGEDPTRYDTSKSIQLYLYKNNQMMMKLHSYEPVRVSCTN